MGPEITLDQLDQAAGLLIHLTERTPMVRAEHQNCIQAIQVIANFINQEKAKTGASAKAEDR